MLLLFLPVEIVLTSSITRSLFTGSALIRVTTISSRLLARMEEFCCSTQELPMMTRPLLWNIERHSIRSCFIPSMTISWSQPMRSKELLYGTTEPRECLSFVMVEMMQRKVAWASDSTLWARCCWLYEDACLRSSTRRSTKNPFANSTILITTTLAQWKAAHLLEPRTSLSLAALMTSIFMSGKFPTLIVSWISFFKDDCHNISNEISLTVEKRHQWVDKNQMVLYGHRSIVNQVRYNPQKCILASSGVEKVIKLWSPFEMDKWTGSLTEEIQNEPIREVFTHEEYISLVHANGQVQPLNEHVCPAIKD